MTNPEAVDDGRGLPDVLRCLGCGDDFYTHYAPSAARLGYCCFTCMEISFAHIPAETQRSSNANGSDGKETKGVAHDRE